ncbi:hypothetical protein OG897_02915 [Streptomyces sp. NBC_00237]|uniref:hypothetical protein n=1 Tax=Streptomyces sp. NBC_00237 TaxID=2975687 RepID=UPI002257497C|nr:hypothetical protein [Streptomyces sp. NBC_00237]MCX5200416.1 hypothetical protein [Streptomyces sp. NBC_00237]
MANTPVAPHGTVKSALAEAQHAVDLLTQALTAAQVTLPSLRIDLTGATSGRPLVELGRLHAGEALRLAQALRPGSPRMGTHGDGKGGSDGDKQQSPRESDGQWNRPVSNPPKKDEGKGK